MKIDQVLSSFDQLLAFADGDSQTTPRQLAALKALGHHKTWAAAGKSLGITYNGVRDAVGKIFDRYSARYSFGNTVSKIEVAPPPKSDVDIEDILAHKRKIYKRKKAHHDYNKLINIAVKDDKPIAVCHIGDPHVDDDGCDIEALERDLTIIRNTPGMYAGHLGDLTNNWVGRLARLYANQTTTASQAIKLVEWMLDQCPVLFLVNGNHDNWQNTDVLDFIMRSSGAVHDRNRVRIGLNFPNGKQVRIHARHSFKGTSIYNPTHGQRRAQLWEGDRDHVYIAGHFHSDGASMIPQSDGTCSWAFQVSGYKVIDEYAIEGGFTEQRANPSLTTIINPYAKNEAELIKPYWDAEAAADYLTFLRRRVKS